MACRALTGSLVGAVGILATVAVGGCTGSDALTGTDAGGVASTLPACDPSTDNLRCDGNTVAYCACTKNGPQEGYDLTGAPLFSCLSYNWVDGTVCSIACDTTIAPSTGCIASTQPIPECAQDGITCWNGNLTYCENGYPLPTTPCADGTQCTLVPGCQALCLSPSATTDPRCPDAPGLSNDFCADNVAYHCACGYLIGTMNCSDAAPCVTVDSYDSWDHASGPSAQCGLPP
jgi:hypothetical protein